MLDNDLELYKKIYKGCTIAVMDSKVEMNKINAFHSILKKNKCVVVYDKDMIAIIAEKSQSKRTPGDRIKEISDFLLGK